MTQWKEVVGYTTTTTTTPPPPPPPPTTRRRVVSQCGLAICIKKYLKAKEELWKHKYFTMQKYVLPKIL
jgi:hypothetical protein